MVEFLGIIVAYHWKTSKIPQRFSGHFGKERKKESNYCKKDTEEVIYSS